MNLTFAAQLNKMITAGLGGAVEAPETGVAVGRRVEYTSIGPAPLLTFEANSELPFKALSINMEPIQDLHGQDAPYPAGGGKNLYNASAINPKTHNGVTATISDDGTVTLNGTPGSGNAFFNVIDLSLESTTGFTWSANNPSASEGVHIVLRDFNNNYAGDKKLDVVNQTCSLSNWANVKAVSIYVTEGTELTNFVLKPQLEKGSTATAYAPYSNICPISGRSEVGVWREATYDTSAEPAITIQLDDIVYGGSLDVVKGVAVIEWANIASYDGETLPGVWISDRDDYAPGTSPTTGAQVCYKLETPITVQLTSQEITTLIGTNNVWSDADAVSLTYGNIYYTEGY